MPKISVVIATYNGADYLREQIESVLNQTLRPAEVIVADDGSRDSTLQIAEEFAASASVPFRVIRNPRRYGYADNFLRAAASASQDWVAFCDQDDVWLPHKLATCQRWLADESILAVAHNYFVMSGTSRLRAARGPRSVRRAAVIEPLDWRRLQGFMGHSLLFRRSLVSEISFLDRPAWCWEEGKQEPHDDWISFLAQSLGRVATIDEPLVAYRVHASNASRAHWGPKGLQRVRLGLTRAQSEFDRSLAQHKDRLRCLEQLIGHAHYGAAALRASQYNRELIEFLKTRRSARYADPWTTRGRAFLAALSSGNYRRYYQHGEIELAKDLIAAVKS